MRKTPRKINEAQITTAIANAFIFIVIILSIILN